ncbi:hypothetical protein GCM10010178_39340 [Lentzea flava]|uniref:Uncharacterized protein n=1 Tax=Lentzea flava TaxID=103732 RepID=A0ABQ2UKV9_9PSEU|nr:hypothetical protein GCM10010178_39340 [Lentzea flava]
MTGSPGATSTAPLFNANVKVTGFGGGGALDDVLAAPLAPSLPPEQPAIRITATPAMTTPRPRLPHIPIDALPICLSPAPETACTKSYWRPPTR